MSNNISFALDNFHHEASRKERRARDAAAGADVRRDQCDQRSDPARQDRARALPAFCDAAVHSGKSFATVALLAEPARPG
jgi:hypothetical protein